MEKEKVVFNGKKINKEELGEQKENLEKKTGVQVVEVKPGEFRTQIRG